MIDGHGDDLYKYKGIEANFSSNVYNYVNHDALNKHISNNLWRIRSYPEPEPYSLERIIAENNSITEDNVCVTNGATEAIYLIAFAFRESSSLILSPTFREYEDACCLHNHNVKHIFNLDNLPDEPSLIWLCNPNNPTGTVTDADYLKELINRYKQHIFIVDQSYEMFACRPTLSIKEMTQKPNVILLHSMTKCFAVPGIRLGFITANSGLISKARSKRMPWSVNALAVEAGKFLLEHTEQYRPDVDSLIKERKRVERELLSTGCIEIYPSDTHYMLVKIKHGTSSALKEFLAIEHHVLIRNAANFAGLDDHHFRIAIQTPGDNNKLIKGIKEWTSTHL